MFFFLPENRFFFSPYNFYFLICNYVCFAWSRLSSECLREGIAKAFRLGIVKKYILDRCPEQIKDSSRWKSYYYAYMINMH